MQSYVAKSDVITQYYTAGPSGAAVKAGTGTHASTLEAAASAARALQLGPADVLLSSAPLHTQLGFAAGVLAPALAGAKLLMPSRVFNAEEALAAATQQRATRVLLASAAEAAALDEALAAGGKKYDLSSLKGGAVLAGAAGALRGLPLKAL